MTDNLLPIQRLWDECWNQRKFDIINEIFSHDFVLHVGCDDSHGTDIVVQVLKSTVIAFPDIHQSLDECFVSSEGIVTTIWRGKGTHDGPYGDIPPTGRPFIYHGITVFKVDNGLIVEAWLSSDEAQQIENLRS